MICSTGIWKASFMYFAERLARTNLIIYFLGIKGHKCILYLRLLICAIQSMSTRLLNTFERYLFASGESCLAFIHLSHINFPFSVLNSCSGSNSILYLNCLAITSLSQLVPLLADPVIIRCLL